VAGRPKYVWSEEELKKLKDKFRKHGWQMGFYLDFKCSYMTCYRKLIELGLVTDNRKKHHKS
jgi:hypothetical protein